MDSELIDRIVNQVVTAIDARVASAAPCPAPAAPAPVPSAKTKPLTPPRPAPKVFITAEMLAQRATTNGGGIIELEHNEYLTPAAGDLVDERHLAVRKASPPPATVPAAAPVPQGCNTTPNDCGPNPPAQANPQPQAPGGCAARVTIGLVTDRVDPKVGGVIRALGYDGISLADYNQTDCWIRNIQALSCAIVGGSATAGVAILPHAADAIVLANKIDGIRAVQGTRSGSVAAALRHFDANMLIVEHAFSTYHEIRAMVRAFATQRTGTAAAAVLMDTVGQLERT